MNTQNYRVVKVTLILFIAFAIVVPITAQSDTIMLTNFPSNNRLYQRNLTTNQAMVPLAGNIGADFNFEKLLVNLNEAGLANPIWTETIDLNYANGQASFSIEIPIKASLTDHEIWLLGIKSNDDKEYIAHWIKVVAGDIYIINGQSNAIAWGSAMVEDQDDFCRSYNDQYGWGRINLSFPGQWGGRMAKRIIETHGIPVAIFNGASQAKSIDTYLKYPDSIYAGNYGALLGRMERSGDTKARAALWFHGEANGWNQEYDTYYNGYQKLHQYWVEDYKIEHSYLFQIRRNSCGHPYPHTMEAQRRIGNNLDYASVMSTTNARHDSCHFYYEKGYRELGDRIFELVNHELYNGDGTDVYAPDIAEAVHYPAQKQIVIEVRHTNELFLTGFPWNDFEVNDQSVTITGGYLTNKFIHLNYTGSGSNIQQISYLGHRGPAEDWIYNAKGVGLIAWHAQPVMTVVGTDDLADQWPIMQAYISDNNTLNLQLNSTKNTSMSLVLSDALGQMVYQDKIQVHQGEQHITIQLPTIVVGMYHLSLINGDGETSTMAIIKP